ncbi:MAG: hypothetical protein KF889_22145 [Alphaproteobacteria bacterium]|nr:hypothetical protein [Alphaproteobacteria bacterium]MCW5743548.1 hypothetical protein [Alphaproteobacteria bacterium]
MRDSTWIYPLANLGHIVGLALLVGPIVALDLRLLGIGRAVSVAGLSRTLTPIAITGLLLQIVSGLLLFIADAAALVANNVFLIKAALFALGIANAIAFRGLWRHALEGWDSAPPALGRAQAALSIAFWFGVAISGRLIAYF